MAIPLRPLFAWALLGYAAIEIFFTLARWMEPSDAGFFSRAAGADFTTLITVGFPILAVLLATWIQPALGMAKPIALAALAEYAAILVLGAMAFVLGLPHIADFDRVTSALSYLVFSFAGLAFAALCAYATVSLAGLRPR